MREQYLYLCRHGYRDDKDYELIGNDGLAKNGIAQIKLLARKLREFDIDHVLVSPFKRTLETAEIIANVLNIPFHINSLYSEWLNVEWHSESPQLEEANQISLRYPHAIYQPSDLILPPYPEALEAMNVRCKRAADAITADSRNILIVTHGIIISHIASLLTKFGPENFNSDVSSLTVLRYSQKKGWEIILNNYLDHLQKYIKNMHFY